MPLGEGGRAADFVSLAIDEVAFVVEMVVDRGMDGAEFLKGVHPSKPQHSPLSSSERLVGILGAVVQPAARLVDTGVTDLHIAAP